MNAFFSVCFASNDWAVSFLRRNYRQIKTAILLVAHASLLGFFFPEVRNGFGEWARNILILILFLSPIARIFPIAIFQLLLGMRRELGILFAYLATVHGVGYLIDPLWFPLPISAYLSSPFQMGYALLAGVAAYVLTLPLLVTSNSLSIRLLRKKWMILHRIVYAVFVFGMIHAFAVRNPSGIGDALLVISLYIALKLLARNPRIAPVSSIREFVGKCYEQFRIKQTPTISRRQG